MSTILLGGAFGLFEWALLSGASEAVARTMAVNVFVFVEICYLFNCRSLTTSMFQLGVFSNRWLWAGVTTMIALQLLFTYSPSLNRILGSEPIEAIHWALILSVALSAYLVVGFEKWVRLRVSDRGTTGNQSRPATA